MTQIDDALKPCPFCGGRGHIAKDPDLNHGDFYFVKCAKCRSKSAEFHANETCPIFYAQVRDAWNRRADLGPQPDPRVSDLLKRLRGVWPVTSEDRELADKEIVRLTKQLATARASLQWYAWIGAKAAKHTPEGVASRDALWLDQGQNAATALLIVEAAPDWEGFCRDLLNEWPVRDVEGSELFDAALSNGLIREIPGGFDPDNHIDAECICPEPGDPWYEYAFRPARADLAPQPDPRVVPDLPSESDELSTMVSDLSHTGDLSMLYRCSIADAITALRVENAQLRAAFDKGGKDE